MSSKTDTSPPGAGPLAGLRVLDCSLGAAGPRATGLLADYGAEVVWIEPPGGDPLRRHEPATVSVLGRGKRSVTLDLTQPADLALLHDAVGGFDVFVESWAPGRAAELGLGHDDLTARHPGLVYCSVSGFGDTGLLRDVPAHEAIVHAVVGTMGEQAGHRDGPIFEGLPFASIGAGYLAAIGILAALHRREEDGRGRRVETSLFDGALAYHSMLWGESGSSGALRPSLRQGTSGTRLLTRTFQCSDGQFIGIHTGAVGAFGRLMQVLGLGDRIPPSPDGMDIGKPLTPEQRQVLEKETFSIFLSQPRDYWVQRLLEADVCGVEHLAPTEVFDQVQARHNQMVVEVDDPTLGKVEQVAPPIRFSAHAVTIPAPCPAPGQHGERSPIPGGTPWRSAEASPRDAASGDESPLLAGLKILDLGAYYAGPYSSRLLADLGADVVKLEPLQGDQLRGLERPFFSAQAGKRSVAANLKSPDLRPAVERLLGWADVVHHNLRPGAAERLALDYDTVHQVNPDIVYLYAPGWGSTGSHAKRQSFAPMLSGYVGASFEVAGRYNEPMPSTGNEDPGNGLVGAAALLMALLERKRGGSGQYVENPQLNAAMTHMAHIVRTSSGEVVGAGRLDTLQRGLSATERLYRTADGWVCIVAGEDGHVRSLATLTGTDLLADPRFATSAARADHDDELADVFERAFEQRKTAEVLAKLHALGVPAAAPAEDNVHALMVDPDQQAVGRVAEVEHPQLGTVREVARLLRVTGSTDVPHRLAPGLGEHTDEVLTELGFDASDVDELRKQGVVR